MVDLDCRGCEHFGVKTTQVLEDEEWKLDIKLSCNSKEECEKESICR